MDLTVYINGYYCSLFSIGKDALKQSTKHFKIRPQSKGSCTVCWNHLSAKTCRLPWNNAGEQYCTHKNFHMQYLKPAGGRRQNRDFKAKAHTYQSSSTLWCWGKDTRFLIHLSYCRRSCKKEMQVLEKPESVTMPRLCNDKMDKSAIPEREKKKWKSWWTKH